MDSSPPSLLFEDEVVKFIEYRELSIARRTFFVIGCVLTIGALLLVCHWVPRLFVLLNYNLTTPSKATKFIVTDDFGKCHTCNRIFCQLAGETFDYFEFKKLRYRYDTKKNRFAPLRFDPTKAFRDYCNDLAQGIDAEYMDDYKSLNGINSIEVPITPLYELIIDEGLHPFIVFQIFSIIIWCLYEYFYYAALVGIISLFGVVMEIYQTRKNMGKMRDMTMFESHVKVLRKGMGLITISSKDIVPGDVFELRSQTTVPCDALLLSGNSLVNEMMLTGESIPVIKTALPFTICEPGNVCATTIPTDQKELLKYFQDVYAEPNNQDEYSTVLDIDRDKVHILYGGTKIVRARNGKFSNAEAAGGDTAVAPTDSRFVVVIAVRTAFSTAKGQLVRSILYPRPTQFKFYEDSFKFIGVLAMFALVGFIANAIIQALQHEEVYLIILKAGDLVTVAVPPTLPAVMSAGTSYALARLKKKGIFCIDPQRINVAGKIRIMCFDKTGTLTEDDLGVHGVQEVKLKKVSGQRRSQQYPSASFSSSSSTPSHSSSSSSSSSSSTPDEDSDSDEVDGSEKPSTAVLMFKKLKQETSQLKVTHTMTRALASCHTVAKIGGTYVGDPMDVKMLMFSGWRMVENLHPAAAAAAAGGDNDGDSKSLSSSAPAANVDDDDDDEEEEIGRKLTEKEEHEREQRVKGKAEDVLFSKAVLASCSRKFLTPHCHAVLCPPSVTLDSPQSKDFIALHRRFDFLSHLQRMSVICRGQDETAPYEVFVKGSPEMVSSLCLSHTIPSTFKDTLATYTRRGLRVLALGYRTLTREALLSMGSPIIASVLNPTMDSTALLTEEEIDRLPRQDVEADLNFLGFLIMENKLRPSSAPAIKRLNNARIKPVMVTGDNALTAVNVARNCGIVPSFVESEKIDGTFRKKSTYVIREIPMFLAELTEDEEVVWRCTDDPKLTLDPVTLYPRLITDYEPPSSSIAAGAGKIMATEQIANLTAIQSPHLPPSSSTPTGSVYSDMGSMGQPMFTVSLIPLPSHLSVHTSVAETENIDTTPSPPPANVSDSKDIGIGTVDTASNHNSSNPVSVGASSDSTSTHIVHGPVPVNTKFGTTRSSEMENIVSGAETPSFVPEGKRTINLWNGGPWAPTLYNQRPFPAGFPRPPKLVVVGDASTAEGFMTPALCSTIPGNVDETSAPPYFLAMTGAAFRVLKAADKKSDQESPFKKAVFLSSVFARMSPDDKASLVESFIDLGFTTGMCGDGANDCGALKAAHVGISLSEVEASIAAPFTSKVASIECVEMVILDGRASLATSFQSFKATAVFAMIQLSTSLVLIAYYALMTDFQFLSIDIFSTLPFLFSIGYSRSNSKLTLKSPQGSLISFPVIFSLISHTVLSFVLQLVMVLVMTQVDDYVAVTKDTPEEEQLQSYAVTAVYLASLFHYLISGVILASYDPFLELFFLNPLLVVGTIFVTAMTFFVTFVRLPWFDDLLQMQPTTDWVYYRWLLITSALYLVVLAVLEYVVAQPNLPKRIYRKLRPRSKLVGKIKNYSEKERAVLYEEELREREKVWQRERLRLEDPADERDDEVLLDPTQALEHNENGSKKLLMEENSRKDGEDVKKVLSKIKPSQSSMSSSSSNACVEDVYHISEDEKKNVYNSIPTSRRVFGKRFYALLAIMDTEKNKA